MEFVNVFQASRITETQIVLNVTELVIFVVLIIIQMPVVIAIPLGLEIK